MNKYAVYSAVYALGVLVGAVAARQWLKTTYEALAQAEIDSVKEVFRKREEELVSHTERVISAEELNGHENTFDIEEARKTLARYPYGSHKLPEQDAAERIQVFMANRDEPDEDAPPQVEVRYGNPYVISDGDFLEGMPGYDKITITYYEQDDVLADDHEDVIHDVGRFIGNDALTAFSRKPGAEGVVYVRNTQLSTDFEVVLDRGSYSETVLGFQTEKPLVRKMRDD